MRGEGKQFACLADAVLIQITPESQIGKAGIEAIDLAVVVAVFLGEGGKAVGGLAASGQRCGVAEQFAAVVDGVVAVAVKDEEGVVAPGPACGSLDAVAIVVEEDGSGGVDAGGFQAVAVEVEDQWVVAYGGDGAGGEEGGGGGCTGRLGG